MDDSIILYVYNKSFTLIGSVDNYISLIWSERYNDLGDFELTVIYSPELKELLKKEYYVTTEYTDRHCIIEKIEFNKDEDGNAQMIVTGRTLESILDRRIIMKKLDFGVNRQPSDQKLTDKLQDAIEIILTRNCINPEGNAEGISDRRRIPGLVFSKNLSERITSLTIEESFDKDIVLEAISSICSDKHVGFKIVLNSSNQFVFSLYKGNDLSKNILFSPYYDNLNDSNYFTNDEKYKNLIFIVLEKDPDVTSITEMNDHPDTFQIVDGTIVTNTEGSDTEYVIETTNLKQLPKWLERREIKVSKSELKENETDDEFTDKAAAVKGVKKLNLECRVETAFDGSIVPDVFYSYRKDYNVGDKVMMEDEYGNSDVVYISEIVTTFDENGLSIVPTFEVIDWEWE